MQAERAARARGCGKLLDRTARRRARCYPKADDMPPGVFTRMNAAKIFTRPNAMRTRFTRPSATRAFTRKSAAKTWW